ncbi:hypothetical protein OAW28_06000 [Alphaproteobacteria bacterium]|nr:hypothetical protein [Alphaproteobacteria bacterium]
MDKNLYSIFDKKAEIYAPPFIELTDGTAIRAVTDLLQRPELPFGKYPEDYTLARIGSWDEFGGIPTADNPPEIVIELATLSQATKKE